MSGENIENFENIEKVQCDICGKEVSADAVEIVHIGGIAFYVCEECLTEQLEAEQCDCCHEWFFIDDLIYVEEEDKYYCEGCYAEYHGKSKD